MRIFIEHQLHINNNKMVNLETEIAGIIQYYYPTEQKPARLWEIVCYNLDLDYEDESAGEIFDTLMEEYK